MENADIFLKAAVYLRFIKMREIFKLRYFKKFSAPQTNNLVGTV